MQPELSCTKRAGDVLDANSKINTRTIRMMTMRLSLLTAAALVLVSTTVFSQEKPADAKPDGIEAGTPAKGLPKGQVRPMTVELAKQLVAAAKKASCSPPKGSCSGAFAVVDDAGVLVYLEIIDGVLAGGPDLA